MRKTPSFWSLSWSMTIVELLKLNVYNFSRIPYRPNSRIGIQMEFPSRHLIKQAMQRWKSSVHHWLVSHHSSAMTFRFVVCVSWPLFGLDFICDVARCHKPGYIPLNWWNHDLSNATNTARTYGRVQRSRIESAWIEYRTVSSIWWLNNEAGMIILGRRKKVRKIPPVAGFDRKWISHYFVRSRDCFGSLSAGSFYAETRNSAGPEHEQLQQQQQQHQKSRIGREEITNIHVHRFLTPYRMTLFSNFACAASETKSMENAIFKRGWCTTNTSSACLSC